MLIPEYRKTITTTRPTIPNLGDDGNNAMPTADSTNAERTMGNRPRPRAAARSDAAPAQGTSTEAARCRSP